MHPAQLGFAYLQLTLEDNGLWGEDIDDRCYRAPAASLNGAFGMRYW